MQLTDVIEQAKTLRLTRGQCLEAHISPDDGQFDIKQLTTLESFAATWGYVSEAVADADPDGAYVGVIHEDGGYLVPLDG